MINLNFFEITLRVIHIWDKKVSFYSDGVKEQPTMQGFEDRADLAAGTGKDISESEMMAIKGLHLIYL